MKLRKACFISLFCIISSSAQAAECSQPTIYKQGAYRYIVSNGVPCQHGQFPNRYNPNTISQQNYQFRMPLHPVKASQLTPLQNRMDFAVGLDGIPFDPGTAEWYNNDAQSGWRYEAMSRHVNLGLDRNHAHVQQNGAYHYHGLPDSLYEALSKVESGRMTLIAYAADGFPVYALYGLKVPTNANSGIEEMHSSYQLRKGSRPNPPGGNYDGRFVQDYAFVSGSGNLDECNGIFGVTPQHPEGIYHYFISNEFPFVPRCFKGTPDSSFMKHGAPPGRGARPGDRPRQGAPTPSRF